MRLYRPPVPTREQIEDAFRTMIDGGFRVEGRLVWTYAFTHWSERQLLELRWRLEDLGYGHASTARAAASQDPDAAPLYRLSMSEERCHTPASLHERLVDISQLAIACNVDFEGWEASRVPH